MEEFEDKSQVDFNTDTITFIGKGSFKYPHSGLYPYTPGIAKLFDGIKEILRHFKVEFVPQNVIVKVICYPNIAICIKLSGLKEEKAMVKFLQEKMESYNKIVADTQKECEGNQFRIKVQTLSGKVAPLIVDPYTPIDILKLKISKFFFGFCGTLGTTTPKQLRLTTNRKQLEDGRTLGDYGIGDKDIVYVIQRMKGGGGGAQPDWACGLPDQTEPDTQIGGAGPPSPDDMVNMLECPICRQLLFAPVVLNCTHSFCQYCIGESRDAGREAGRDDTCPSCRQEIKSESRVNLLDKILEMVESDKDEREEQKRMHSQFMENRPRQVGNAIPEQVVARDETHRVMTELEVANGNLSQVRIQFDHAPAVINPEDTGFEVFRNFFNTNEEYERQELL